MKAKELYKIDISIAPPLIVDRTEYYTIKQMFETFGKYYVQTNCYNTFYKKFRAFVKRNNLKPFHYSNLRLYSLNTAVIFLEQYDHIKAYSNFSK